MFRVGDFSTPLRRHAVFPCLSTVIPASSVKCIAFSRLAPGSPAPVFSPCVVTFRFFAAFLAPAWAFLVSRAGHADFCSIAGRFPRRGRIPIGKQALPRSAGKRETYRKRRKLTNELPPLLNGIIGHALRFAPAALLPRNIRYGKTACRPTLPVSRG